MKKCNSNISLKILRSGSHNTMASSVVDEERELQQDFLGCLPFDAAEILLTFLAPEDLFRCCQVCKSWHEAVCKSMVWRRLCHGLPIILREPNCGNIDWKKGYTRAAQLMRTITTQTAFEVEKLDLPDFCLVERDDLRYADYDEGHLLAASLYGWVWLYVVHENLSLKREWRLSDVGIVMNSKLVVNKDMAIFVLLPDLIVISDLQGNKKYNTITADGGNIFGLDFCSELNLLVCYSESFHFNAWEFRENIIHRSFTVDSPARILYFDVHIQSNPDRLLLICRSLREIKVWELLNSGARITPHLLRSIAVPKVDDSSSFAQFCYKDGKIYFFTGRDKYMTFDVDGDRKAVIRSFQKVEGRPSEFIAVGRKLALATGSQLASFMSSEHDEPSVLLFMDRMLCGFADILCSHKWLDGFRITEVLEDWKKQLVFVVVPVESNSLRLVWMTAPVV